MTSSSSYCSRAMVFCSEGSHLDERHQIEQVLAFYGLQPVAVDTASHGAVESAFAQIKDLSTVAILIAQDALPAVDRARFISAATRPNGAHIPVLVFGIRADQDASELKTWSNGAVLGCNQTAPQNIPTALEVGQTGDLTSVLKGSQLPAVAAPNCEIRLEKKPTVQIVLSASGKGLSTAVLARIRNASGDVYLLPQMKPFDTTWTGHPEGLAKAFSSLAPFILFTKQAAGDRGWHLDGHYANLTIDDPWLTEPYGHLSYTRLLGEMEAHNFHTTIAFVPWNFDRSEPGTAHLFRTHPSRFSVCIHGNDHIHREFGDYVKVPLCDQDANIRQALARMERFYSLTGVSADRFMVFPHGAAPEPTLGMLKTYDFLGTANSLNVPLGAPFPTDPVFLLRPYTFDYANFLGFSRYSAEVEIPRLEIAIHSFLGNPLLFYGHQQLFASGIGAFNEIADFVNRLQPNTQWRSVGEIASHLNLLRQLTDGVFESQMLSNQMSLHNQTPQNRFFEITRNEHSLDSVRAVTVNGTKVDYRASGKSLSLSLFVPAGMTVSVRVSYKNDLDLALQDVRKKGMRAAILRRLSDFRDLYLSRSFAGRILTQTYYRNRWDSIEEYLEQKWLKLIAFFGISTGQPLYRRGEGKKG